MEYVVGGLVVLILGYAGYRIFFGGKAPLPSPFPGHGGSGQDDGEGKQDGPH